MTDRAVRAHTAPRAEQYRFFAAGPLTTGSALELRGDAAHRIARVLRLSPGTIVELFDGRGRIWPATLESARPAIVRLSLGEPVERPRPAPTILLAALIRPSRFEWLVEKATELGATAIRPVICARGAVRPAEFGVARLDRWRRIAVEAAEQSGRATVPEVLPPIPLETALRDPGGWLFIAAEPVHGRRQPLGLAAVDIGDNAVTILTGPEGGFTPDEIVAAIGAGAMAVSLGPTILRAETAAVAALAVIADARAGPGRSADRAR